MDKYVGTKMIEATPMNENDFLSSVKNVSDEYLNDRENREGYLVKYEDGYESWSPKEVFEKAYNDVNTCLSFGQAIEMMKLGFKVARQVWNSKGMWIYIQNGTTITKDMARNDILKSIDGDIVINSHIDMKSDDGSITIGWSASQIDMLANDWVIVE